jgi:hypothetical protein
VNGSSQRDPLAAFGVAPGLLKLKLPTPDLGRTAAPADALRTARRLLCIGSGRSLMELSDHDRRHLLGTCAIPGRVLGTSS